MKLNEFVLQLGKLKKIKRTGWIKYKIPYPESVAEHSFSLAVLAMFLAPKVKVNQDKTVKMALIHDIGEAEIGDIVTSIGNKTLSNISEKLREERSSLQRILSLINTDEYVTLFDEFQENKTKEAQFVRQLDKLEMALQAYEYEKEYSVKLEEFFENARESITHSYLREMLSSIEKLRDSKINRT